MNLYEILVPTKFGFPDPTRAIKTRHHKQWDKVVRSISGGLTLMTPSKGQYLHGKELMEEKVIPVRIACEEKDMRKIVQFTLAHYRQKAVMYYELSNKVYIVKS